MIRFLIIAILCAYAVTGFSQQTKPISDSSFKEVNLDEVTIAAGRFAECPTSPKNIPRNQRR